MAGKEAYCFGCRENWVLAICGSTFMVLVNLFGTENRLFYFPSFLILVLLFLPLTGKNLKHEFLSSRTTNICGSPNHQE